MGVLSPTRDPEEIDHMARPARPTLQQVFDLLDGFCEEGRIETGFVWKSKKLTRKNFFEEAHWAILVAGRAVDNKARVWRESWSYALS